MSLNKTIFICWFQGFDNAPEIVKKCLQSWIHYNPRWNIVKIDNMNLHNFINLDRYIDKQKQLDISINHLSDILRIILLNKYGGLWVDATTFCNRSLDEWLEPLTKTGFFAFSKPNNDILIASWFIYSDANNYLIKQWEQEIISYFNTNQQPIEYLIIHFLFGKLYMDDNQFKKEFENVPVMQSNLSNNGVGPHFLQTIGMFNNITDGLRFTIDIKLTPLYKLTYKCDYEKDYNENTILHYLFSTIK